MGGLHPPPCMFKGWTGLVININKQRKSLSLTYSSLKEKRFENIPGGSSLILFLIKYLQENKWS